MAKQTPEIVVFLPNIRSAYNVGSIFRTSDAAGVSKIYLAGHSPCPTDQFGRARQDLSKVALGAEKSVPWEYQRNAYAILAKLKAEGFFVVAIEQSKDSVDYRSKDILKHARKNIKEKAKTAKGIKLAFVFGNEVKGISEGILKRCHIIAEIPMKGEKESLNVSVAAGVALFGMLVEMPVGRLASELGN